MYYYIKDFHIVFIVTWFAGLFYMPRLLIYNREAADKPEEIKKILQLQFGKMMRPLWFGITWPSAVLTLIFGLLLLWRGGWMESFRAQTWLQIKLIFVFFLYLYHFSLQFLFRQQLKGVFRYTSQQLRVWNEVATIFLVAIVMLAAVKQNMSWLWGLAGLILFVIVLMTAIKIYKSTRIRNRK